MSIVTEDQIRTSLKQCMDPEIPISIVDLGLIYGIDISEENDVDIKMTMTTKGCPLHDTMVDDVKRYTKKVSGVNNVNVDIVWDPPWSMDKISDEAKSMMKNMGGLSTPAPLDYEVALLLFLLEYVVVLSVVQKDQLILSPFFAHYMIAKSQ